MDSRTDSPTDSPAGVPTDHRSQGWFTRRAVAALSRLAEDGDEADREWAEALLAEVDEVPSGPATARWVLGGVWMLLTGSVSGRRSRFAAVVRRPARWSQRLLSLLLLPHLGFLVIAWGFAQVDDAGALQLPGLLGVIAALTLTMVLAWWRPVPAMALGVTALVAEVGVVMSQSHAAADGGPATLASRFADAFPFVAYGVLPMLTLMASVAAISWAPRVPTAHGRDAVAGAAQRTVTTVVLFAVLGTGPGFLAAMIAEALGQPIDGSPIMVVAGLLTAVVVPVCVLFAPMAQLSRPVAASVASAG